jgi:hypothetical protein
MMLTNTRMTKVFITATLNIIATILFGSFKNYAGWYWDRGLFYALSGILPMLIFFGVFSTLVMLGIAIWQTSVAVINIKGHKFVTVIAQILATLFFCYFAANLNYLIAGFLVHSFSFDPFAGQ